jgi:hypothetical protein
MDKTKKVFRILIACTIIVVALLNMFGCRNNLVNKWDDCTPDPDVFYKTPEITEPANSIVPETEIATEAPQENQQSDKVTEYGLAKYWQAELDDTVVRTQQVLSETGELSSFLWYTDVHWTYGSMNALKILKYLEDGTGITYTNFGGDLVNTYNVEEDENIVLTKKWREQSLNLKEHHSVVGNHDDEITITDTEEELYEFLISPELSDKSVAFNGFDYYIDNPSERTRYIYLSTGLEELSSDTLNFFVNALKDTPDSWHVILVSHIWFNYYDSAKPKDGEVPEYVKPILKLADQYNVRGKGILPEYEFVYDFSETAARVEFCIGGHTHVDFDFRTEGGIPIIITQTDSYHIRGESVDIENANESSVSVIVADYSSGKINIIRAGRGDDRVVLIEED